MFIRLFRQTFLGWALVACVLGMTAQSASAQSIPVRLIGGRIVVKATLKGPAGEVPSHLLVDLGDANPLVLHKNAVEMMGLEQQVDKRLELTIGNASFSDVKVYQRDEFREVEQITRDYAGELEEVPVSGVLGLGAFPPQAIQLDLPAKVIRFGPIDHMVKSEGEQTAELAYEPTGSGLVFPAELPDGQTARVLFGTRQYESLAEFDAFQSLRIGRPDRLAARVGSIDLLSRGAFRPSGLRGVSRPLPELVLGVELVAPMRVTIDTQSKRIRFEVAGAPLPHAAEQAYFAADLKNDADAIQAFLESNPQSWLRREASARLLEMRLVRQSSSDAACTKAIELYAASLPADRRSQQLLALVDQHLSATDPRGLLVLRTSLDLATASAGEDMNAAAVHQINARKGLLAMRQGNLKEARRLLLSAAFGMPGDVSVNLWLGELYRRSRQPARAWSRYVEAAISRDGSVEAVRALEQLGSDPDLRASMTVADAELLLEGRLLSFAPPRQRSPEESSSVRLVELFTNATKPNSLGAQLAFDGLRQFYADTPVVFVSYHLDGSMGNPTSASRMRLYALESSQAVACDGNVIDMDSHDETDAPKLFQSYLKRLAGPPPADLLRIDSVATWTGETLDARIRVQAANPPIPDVREARLFPIVIERCVFALGGNGIGLHYNVARATMGQLDGLPVDPALAEQTWNLSIRLDEMKRVVRAPATTAAATQASRGHAGPPWMRAPDPDPRECWIAIIVQDVSNYRILGAVAVKPAAAGGGE